MVSIVSSSTVTPSEPTPQGCLWLSGCDQTIPWTHAPSIYIFKPEAHQTQSALDTLRHSLAKILVPYYPLAGRLRWIEGGRLEADCNALGVTLLEAESTKALNDYGDFKPNETIRELVPMADYSKPIQEIPLLLVQLTTFPCGGLSLGIALSHPMADGIAAIQFINTWAKLARGHILEEDDMPFLDRSVLRCRQPLQPPRFDHPEYKPLPTLLGTSDATAERKKETCAELLKLTREQVEHLRNEASEGPNDKNGKHTRYEAIAAHIWRCACKARKNEYLQPTVVRIIGDVRNRINPPLPQNYFGNAILRSMTRNVTAGEVVSNPLSYAAKKMREALVLFRDEEYLRSQLDLIESTEELDTLRLAFYALGRERARIIGNPNLSIGSWTTLPVYDADFGWGKALYMGPGALNADGKVYIVPGPQDGSLIVAIRLQTAHMPDFKKFFYQSVICEKNAENFVD